ncbi:molybdopterin-dependent oxidoreductase [Dongia deserti]|uniref:molybdopterin-dependent oxidoreductase n=1 Tax=Dongia deserti TaxID=2268030 RepID=UPI000E650739|nr:molybdopterin-dependent oxidoreductase [Dongia deserti]
MQFLKVLLSALALLFLGAAPSAALGEPALLTISGEIGSGNQDGKLVLDRGAFEAMPMSIVKTETPWTEGMVTFEGVPLKALLDLAAANGETIHAVALNDYAVDIPVGDSANPKVIVAYRMNGQTMRVRDKGPLWLIYPLSDEPSLRTEATHTKMIWQIKAFEIR